MASKGKTRTIAGKQSTAKGNVPELKYHLSGQDRVWLDGRYFYCGEFGTVECQTRYDTLIRRWLDNGRKMPADEATRQGETVITVSNVTAEYRRLIDQRPKQLSRHGHLCTLLEGEYGDVPVSEFGPIKLAEIRDLLVVTGIARPTVNE